MDCGEVRKARGVAVGLARLAMSRLIHTPLLLLVLTLATHRVLADPPVQPAQQIDDQAFDEKMDAALRDRATAGQVFKTSDLLSAFNQPFRRTLKLPTTQKTVLEDGEIHSRAVRSTLAFFSNTVAGSTAQRGSRLGAAVIIDPSGLAITCFHAIRFNEPFVMVACTADGRQINIKSIISVFPRQDLAVIQLEDDSLDCLPIRTDAPPGTQVRALGHPLGMHFFMTQGVIGRYENLRAEGTGKSGRPRMALSMQTVEGFSGGPVLDNCGNLLGMLDSMRAVKRENDTYTVASAIPGGMILNCLKGDYHEPLTVNEKQAMLEKQEVLDTGQTTEIASRNSQGSIISKLEGGKTTVRALDAAGKVIAEGIPGDDFRSRLPGWAQEVYDVNMKAVDEAKKN
jgi:S1-C subfamily serine protease